MWRPRTIGSVIAERTLTLERPGQRPAAVRIAFGRPVRAPRPRRGDPWWCPVKVSGLGKRRLEMVPGEDSLQALVLALDFVNRVLPLEAWGTEARLQWLGEQESLVFAHTFTLGLLSRNLQNCMAGLAEAVAALEQPGTSPRTRRLARRLHALVASGGHTADPRRLTSTDRRARGRR